MKTKDYIESILIGKKAKANHPITCLNPERYFTIKYVKFEDGNVFVRGEKTCWFGNNAIKIID